MGAGCVNSALSSVIIAVERDEPFIAALAAAVRAFVSPMLEKRKELTQRYGPFIHPDPKPRRDVMDALGVSDADVEAIWQSRFP